MYEYKTGTIISFRLYWSWVECILYNVKANIQLQTLFVILINTLHVIHNIGQYYSLMIMAIAILKQN